MDFWRGLHQGFAALIRYEQGELKPHAADLGYIKVRTQCNDHAGLDDVLAAQIDERSCSCAGSQPVSEGRQAIIRQAMAFKHGEPLLYHFRSEEQTSELQSLMRISYDVFCLTKQKKLHKQ